MRTTIAFATIFALLTSSTLVSAEGIPATTPGDAPFGLSSTVMDSVITCVGGLENVTNPYLLVPGTGGTAAECWDTNYKLLLGRNVPFIPGGGLGYDVCYVSPPPNMLGDIQVSSEYVVWAIQSISRASVKNGGPSAFPIHSWSQGGLAISWALTFWPSIRKNVSHFISFAGDFGGVLGSPIPSKAGSGAVRRRQMGGKYPAFLQQAAFSNLVTTANQKGNKYAWVPTTSLYSATDDIISPEGTTFNDTAATSYIGGDAGNLLAQGFCSKGIQGTILHETWQTSAMGFAIVKMALNSPRGFLTQAEAVAAVAAGTIPCNTVPAAGIGGMIRPGALNSSAFASTQHFHRSRKVTARQMTDPLEPPLKAYVATFPDNPVHGY